MRLAVFAAVLTPGVLATSAQAADPGRWTFTGESTLPLYYYQEVTSDPSGDVYFDGVDCGLCRTDSQLGEEARNHDGPSTAAASSPARATISSRSGRST